MTIFIYKKVFSIDMDELQALREFGLSEKEAKVYLILLRDGASTVTPLVAKTQLQRGSLYDILERLIEKGIISYVIKANRKHFEAIDPNKLLNILHEKEEMIKEILPKLLFYQKQDEAKVTVYKGQKGLRSLYLDVLKEGKESFVMGASGMLVSALGENFYIQFQRRQKEAGNSLKIIFSEEMKGKTPEMANAQSRFIPQGRETPSHTLIYGNKVVIHIFELTPMAIQIDSKEVAKSYLNFFNHLWGIAKP